MEFKELVLNFLNEAVAGHDQPDCDQADIDKAGDTGLDHVGRFTKKKVRSCCQSEPD